MEEIARIYRYENIPATLPAGRFAPPVLPKIEQLTKKVKDVLFAEGFQELNTFSFMSAKTAEKFSRAKSSLVEIVNPLSQEYQYLRTSLLPALLSAIQENQDENILRLFEINPVYVKEGDKYSEPQLLTGVIIGPSPSYPDRPDYPTAAEFFQAKGVVEQILTELKINFSFKEKKESNFHPGRTAAIIAKRDEIGVVGELHPNFLAELNIKKRVAVFIVGIEALKDIAGEIIYKTVSKYPEARFDLSLLADKETLAETIEKTAKAASEFVKKFDLFDYYEGKGISEDKKSLTYHVVLQAKDHTLSDEEIKGVREKIIKELKNINVLLRV
jgi:phenylalanyl-tRNA synthetase beta chain